MAKRAGPKQARTEKVKKTKCSGPGGSLTARLLTERCAAGAYLRFVWLSFWDLSGVDLRNADLMGANLCNTNLSGADLRGTNLRMARLIAANLNGANLEGARVEGADFRGVEGLTPTQRSTLAHTGALVDVPDDPARPREGDVT